MIIFGVIFIIAFFLIVEIFTILFQLTGLSKEKSKFQVISILTGTGFTTKESELITTSKIRRRIAQAIMIFGYLSTAVIVTIMFSVVSRIQERRLHEYVVGIVIIAVVYVVYKFSPIGKYTDRFIEKIATRALFGKDTNTIIVKDSYSNNVVICEIVINIMPEVLNGKNLIESELSKKYGIMVLVVQRNNDTYSKVNGEMKFRVNDVITVFGDLNTINQIFYRTIKC